MKLSNYKALSFLNYQQLKEMIDDFSSLHYAIVKGEVLSQLCYNHLGERISSDIDILVPREELSQIENILNKHGFVSQTKRADRILKLSASHELGAFIKEDNGIRTILDINFDIFWGEYTGERVNMTDFLSDTVEVNIYGVAIQTLPLLKTVVQLILHHYKEMNSLYHLATHDTININMFNDVYQLIKNNKERISLGMLYDISLDYKIVPYMYYVFFYTRQLFEDKLLDEACTLFQTSDGIDLLDSYGLTEDERKRWKVDFKTRLLAHNAYELIKDDLNESDLKKIALNTSVFG